MGDNIDGSSGAAHSAQLDSTDHTDSFIKRLFGGKKTPEPIDTPKMMQASSLPTGDLGNLNSMRLEDVAIPRADITAVAEDTNLKDLVAVFKEAVIRDCLCLKSNWIILLGLSTSKTLR